MELYKILFAIGLLFQIIVCERIQIRNFEEIVYPSGKSEYAYQFSQSILPDKNGAYFFFKFTNTEKITLSYIEPSSAERIIEAKSNDTWINFKVSNLEQQTFYFNVINNDINSGTMNFIDNTKEINTTLTKFINLNLTTDFIEDNPPNPIIFNLDTIKEDEFYYFEENNSEEESSIEGDHLLSYCQINENECIYNGSNSIHFEIGKKYNIKINCYKKKSNAQYYFNKFIAFQYLIKEIGIGAYRYQTNGIKRYKYFLLNLKNLKNLNKLYFSVNNHNYDDNKYYYSFITNEEKNNLPENINDFSYSSYYPNKDPFLLKLEDDYLIIKIFENSKDSEIYDIDIFILNNYYSIKDKINLILSVEIPKGNYTGIIKSYSILYNKKYVLLSSEKNMKCFGDGIYTENYKNIFYFNDTYDRTEKIIVVDSSNSSSIIKGYLYNTDDKYSYCSLFFNFVFNENLNYLFTQYGTDYIHLRTSLSIAPSGYNTSYFFDINEKYYLYINKIYGNSNFYRYNYNLNSLTDVIQFQTPFQSYEDSYDYELINNKLIMISGYQLITFVLNYDSLYDIFIQKVNDNEYVQNNSTISGYNNLIKLFQPNKNYILNFTVDHLIKLDRNFLDAEITFINENGVKYVLNEKNKVIKNFTGDNIKVTTNKNALVYFYQRIKNYDESGRVIFNKALKGQNMRIKILLQKTLIKGFVIKDLCFDGYYPMYNKYESNLLYQNAFIYINFQVDNLLDQIDYDLYEEEGEQFIIYFFTSVGENNLPIFEPNSLKIIEVSYSNNLLTPKNKYNFEVIPANSTGSINLDTINKTNFKYQFFMCESKDINFTINHSLNQIDRFNIEKDEIIEKICFNDNSLGLSFESDNEFLFIYTIFNLNDRYNAEGKKNSSILSLNEIENNIIQIKFLSAYNSLTKYHIIVAIKDELNNIESFSNPCYVAKKMINNSNEIVVKTIVEKTKNKIIASNLNINKLEPNEKSELVAILIIQSIDGTMEFSLPKEFKLEKKEIIEIKEEELNHFDSKNNYIFKYEYSHKSELQEEIIFIFDIKSGYSGYLILSQSNDKQIIKDINSYTQSIRLSVEKSETFYIEFYCYPDNKDDYSGNFNLFTTGNTIDTIDLNERLYYKFYNIELANKPNPDKYIINNLLEDKYVFFTYKVGNTLDIYDNPFEICDSNNKCTNNITLYKFEKGNNYIIYINFVKKNKNIDGNYHSVSHFFFPILENTIENNIVQGEYLFSIPKIFTINMANIDYLNCLLVNRVKSLISGKNEEIMIEDLNYLKYDVSSEAFTLYKKNNKYAVIIVIPNIKGTKLMIVNSEYILSSTQSFSLSPGDNAIITDKRMFKPTSYKPDKQLTDIYVKEYNVINVVSSPVKNLKLIVPYEPIEKVDTIVQNDIFYNMYVDKYEKNIKKISIINYLPRYAIYGILNNYTFDNSISKLSNIQALQNLAYLKEMKSILIRLNTDMTLLNEFFNFYVYNFEEKIKMYFKKYYGTMELYEFNANLENDFKKITRPPKTFANKKCISKKIYNLKNNTILSGYYSRNSLVDIYIEIDDNSTNINKISSELSSTNQLSKYLKKDIEYNVNFHLDNLIKLDPEFDSEVYIYKDKNKIILNRNNPTGVFEGDNVKIKSNNDAMIYFYFKLTDLSKLSQHKIDPEMTGKNLEIKVGGYGYYIDFGFEGYAPISSFKYKFSDINYIYMPNIYDKLKTKLVKDEFLYLYVDSLYYPPEFNYSTNINNKNNEYNFLVIQKNSINDTEEKTLIINGEIDAYIRYQVYYCESPHTIKIYHKDNKEETSYNFYEHDTYKENRLKGNIIKLTFDSEYDFVFAYSLLDDTDINIENKYSNWRKERQILNDLNIKEIVKKDPKDIYSNIISVTFNPNYINSTTRYILVIAPEDENNTNETFANPCYITKIVTEKRNGIKIMNIYDTGENGAINIDVDISEILVTSGKYIANIISQELRFNKELNYYKPYNLDFEAEKPLEIELDSESEFNFDSNKIYFNLPYNKNSLISEIFLLFYKLEKQYPININIKGPNNYEKLLYINKTNGYINFTFDEGGSYRIVFLKDENNTEHNDIIKGQFKIVSTEYPFKLNIKEDVYFDELYINEPQVTSLKMNIDSLEKDYTKKIETQKDLLNQVILISKDNEEYKHLNSSYYTFEKNSNYSLEVSFNKKAENLYVFEKLNIIDYSLDNIKKFINGNIKYIDTNDKFITINWTRYENISITVKKNNPKFYVTEVNEYQFKNLVKEFQNIKFEELENLNMAKRENISYEVLMIQLEQNETEILFESKANPDIGPEEDEDKEEKPKESGGIPLSLVFIIAISVFSFLVILIVIFLIIRCVRKKQNVDIEKLPNKNEKLLNEY